MRGAWGEGAQAAGRLGKQAAGRQLPGVLFVIACAYKHPHSSHHFLGTCEMLALCKAHTCFNPHPHSKPAKYISPWFHREEVRPLLGGHGSQADGPHAPAPVPPTAVGPSGLELWRGDSLAPRDLGSSVSAAEQECRQGG